MGPGSRSGAEAIALLRASDPNKRWHVLLDCGLAGDEDGRIIADRVLSDFGERVQVTVMSAETNEELMDEVRLRGIMLLRKPVKPIRLRATLTAGSCPSATRPRAAKPQGSCRASRRRPPRNSRSAIRPAGPSNTALARTSAHARRHPPHRRLSALPRMLSRSARSVTTPGNL